MLGMYPAQSVIYDELIGPEQTPRQQGDRFAAVRELEAMTPMNAISSGKTRVHLYPLLCCRQVCVACDCRTCIFDEMKPQWVGRGNQYH
jgi:hypothetical protein